MMIKSGRVKYAAGDRTFPSKYSDKLQQNIVLTMEDGTEEKIYFDQGRLPHAHLQRGQEIRIVYEELNGKPIRKLFVPEQKSDSFSTNSKLPLEKPDAEKFILEKLKIHDTVQNRVRAYFSEDTLTSEDIRAIATSIIIEGNRTGIDFRQLIKKEESQVTHYKVTKPEKENVVTEEIPF